MIFSSETDALDLFGSSIGLNYSIAVVRTPARARLFLAVMVNWNIGLIVNENSEILEISEFFAKFRNWLWVFISRKEDR